MSCTTTDLNNYSKMLQVPCITHELQESLTFLLKYETLRNSGIKWSNPIQKGTNSVPYRDNLKTVILCCLIVAVVRLCYTFSLVWVCHVNKDLYIVFWHGYTIPTCTYCLWVTLSLHSCTYNRPVFQAQYVPILITLRFKVTHVLATTYLAHIILRNIDFKRGKWSYISKKPSFGKLISEDFFAYSLGNSHFLSLK